MSRPCTPNTKAKIRAAFLEVLATGATVGDAAASAGISCRTAYAWRKTDATFDAEWDGAYAAGGAALEAEATRRAVHGVPRTIFHKSKPVGTNIAYSDTLLMFLMCARDPYTYCAHAWARRLERELAEADARKAARALLNAPCARAEAIEAIRGAPAPARTSRPRTSPAAARTCPRDRHERSRD